VSAPPAERKASGSPPEGGEMKLSSIKIHLNFGKKLWNTDLHRFSQINYFSSAWRLKVQCSIGCGKKLAFFFLAEGDGFYWFLNLSVSVKICVQDFVFVSNFRI
jgi:hypothetical protein